MDILSIDASTDLEELTILLNRSYKKLADKGFRFLASHQDVDMTRKRLEKNMGFVVKKEGKIIATICYHPPGTTKGHHYYERPGVASFGQFAVAPELQNSGIGSCLMDFVERKAIEDGAEEMVLDTAEGASDLFNFYSKRGYRIVEYAQWDVTNYRSVILSKKLC
jgi:predicted N-acetyltransferase YhbS